MANEEETRYFWIPCCYMYYGADEDQFCDKEFYCEGNDSGIERFKHEPRKIRFTWDDGYGRVEWPPKSNPRGE